ncbi:LysR family transcriptional regulator [Paraburkholderia sp. BCC1884]|uniref:LysR family transcriptional regulator n=1 Tax=Paraburkholderia sp. BCC1884 TaxID=2562668 RepID=UPI001182FAAC|nr:LysR family transcriptional regulator [Paraburkholderia sp. BCC1884]
MLSLRHIEIFHAVMRTGSITAAAESLNVTQPAVSTVLKHFENRLHMQLFDRVNGRLRPTPEAEALLPDVTEIFNRLEAVERLSRDLAGGLRGTLSLAATSPLANGLVAQAVASFCKARPDARVALQSLSSPVVLERVVNREVDLGVAYEPIIRAEVETEVISHGSIACVLPESHPIAEKSVIAPSDLLPYPIITYLPQALLRPYVDKAMSDAGVALNVTIEVALSVTAIMLASNGAGIALVEPDLLHAMRLPGITSRPLVPRVSFKALLIRNRSASRSRLVNEFVDHLRLMTTQPPLEKAL